MDCLSKDQLYPLIDALGMTARVSTSDKPGKFWLQGDAKVAIDLPALEAQMLAKAKIIDSFVRGDEVHTSGARVEISGHLQLLVLYDHNYGELQVLVLDASQLGKVKTVFADHWSRAHTYKVIAPAVRGWYVYTSKVKQWVEYDRASKRIAHYNALREAGVGATSVWFAIDKLLAGGEFESVVKSYTSPKEEATEAPKREAKAKQKTLVFSADEIKAGAHKEA